MASFIENLPDYSHQQGVTYKHVTLMSELSHAVERRGLMSVSGVEQDVVCQSPSLGAHYEAVAALVGNLALAESDRLRLVLLFGLRYERDGQAQVAALLRTLGEQGMEQHRVALLRFVLQQCRADKRVADIFSDRTMSSRFASLAKQHLKVGLQLGGLHHWWACLLVDTWDPAAHACDHQSMLCPGGTLPDASDLAPHACLLLPCERRE
jgi:vacuolar protein sorting-associated protein 45